MEYSIIKGNKEHENKIEFNENDYRGKKMHEIISSKLVSEIVECGDLVELRYLGQICKGIVIFVGKKFIIVDKVKCTKERIKNMLKSNSFKFKILQIFKKNERVIVENG